MIECRDVELVYEDHGREVVACGPANLVVESGEFLGILGPSGSGKSSLLYLLSGLKTPTRGTITFEGEQMSVLDDRSRAAIRLRDFGFVFQYPFLVSYLSAAENVLLARPDQPDMDAALDLLGRLGLGSKVHRKPFELSGGEKQRICVARALMGNPRVIFADEPTAALDHTNGSQVVKLLREQRGDGTLVLVTHDPSMLEGADRVIEMADGAIVQR